MPKKSVVNKTAVFEVLCASKEAVKKKKIETFQLQVMTYGKICAKNLVKRWHQ